MDNQILDNEGTKQPTIIRHGVLYQAYKQFECKCGCIFRTSDMAGDIIDTHDGAEIIRYMAYCPECDRFCYVDEKRRKEAR